MTGARRLELHARGRVLALGERPWLMGIVNATPDSFSDPGRLERPDELVAHARRLVLEGADVIDVGGESGVTSTPPVTPGDEIERVVPLIERIARERGTVVAVDTYKPAVAEAAVAVGAAIVNDVSGLRDPELADVCARTGAALVLTHTVGAPKEKVLEHPYDDLIAEVVAFLGERIELAVGRGVAFEQLIVDPGIDLGKNPAQTVALLRDLEPLHALGRPVLLAASRKDFVGALTGRRPRERLGGTLAALGEGADAGAHLLRVHDVAAAADFLAVRAALRGERPVDRQLRLPDELRREAAAPDAA